MRAQRGDSGPIRFVDPVRFSNEISLLNFAPISVPSRIRIVRSRPDENVLLSFHFASLPLRILCVG